MGVPAGVLCMERISRYLEDKMCGYQTRDTQNTWRKTNIIDKNRWILSYTGRLNLVSSMRARSRQKTAIHIKYQNSNTCLHWLNLTDIYIALNPLTTEQLLFSKTQNPLAKVDHILYIPAIFKVIIQTVFFL